MTSAISWNLAGCNIVKWTLKEFSPAVIGFTGYLLIWSCAGGRNKAGHQKSLALKLRTQFVHKGKNP